MRRGAARTHGGRLTGPGHPSFIPHRIRPTSHPFRMPTLTLADGYPLHYVVDDFTDPWTTPQSLLLIHGFTE